MKKLQDNNIVYAPTDLASFLKCNHLSWLDHKKLTGELSINKTQNDPFIDLLRDRGLDHELNYLKNLNLPIAKLSKSQMKSHLKHK